jgi:CNT family concentrative nucleoside transporter
VFAFTALPTIIFISSFFTVLYYYGILQRVVALMARAMMYLMRTSGAETLSVAANVFMGQTEAPLIVKPYVPRMTQSELLTLMVGGMAHISGGVMAVYIGLGADAVAILTTSVMAAPCSLYLSKLVPEMHEPETRGRVKMVIEKQHVNVIDAAASGASDGMTLAINVAAMLIAFLAFIALFDYVLGLINPSLTLARVFSVVFAPAAVLMGVPSADVAPLADLLGTKLVANEFVAFVKLTTEYRTVLSPRSYVLATYALTGFANLARSDSARRHWRDGADPAQRPGAPRHSRAVRGVPGDAHQRIDRVVVSSAIVRRPMGPQQEAGNGKCRTSPK